MDRAVVARTEAGSLLILRKWQIRRASLTSQEVHSIATIDGRRVNLVIEFEGEIMDAMDFLNTNVCRDESSRAGTVVSTQTEDLGEIVTSAHPHRNGIDVSTQTQDLQENVKSAHPLTKAFSHGQETQRTAISLDSPTQKDSLAPTLPSASQSFLPQQTFSGRD
uniref:Outer capsid protein VP4 n=1 Tax=Lygus hesperus TaxID=30085 RepID=A0A0A9Y2V9_LYGHE